MYLIERVSNGIASKIASILDMDKQEEEVLAYGAFGFIQTIFSIMLIIIFGLLFNVLFEVIIISFSASVLRKYSGGVHANTPNRCAIIGMVTFGTLALLVNKATLLISTELAIMFMIISLILSFNIIYKFSPVDSPQKPITSDKIRQRLRNGSFTTLFVIVIITIILFGFQHLFDMDFLIIIMCFYIGIVWQSLMLTVIGYKFINSLDTLIEKTITYLRR